MTTRTRIPEHVTCDACRARLAECPTNEHGHPLAAGVYDVGNPAGRPDVGGHAFYHSQTGRTALCVARRRTDD